MREDERWVDITTVASDYDVEIDVASNRRRWRPRTFPFQTGGIAVIEWQYGDPPNKIADKPAQIADNVSGHSR